MRWTDIEGDWWTIPAEFSKNKLSHRVPLSPLAMYVRELLRPHYRRWRQDGRSIVQSMQESSGDLEVRPGMLRVSLAPQSAPHRSRALAGLCEELNTLKMRFPGSDLRLNFLVQDYKNVS